LSPLLNLETEPARGEKTTLGQMFTPIRPRLPTARLPSRIRFC